MEASRRWRKSLVVVVTLLFVAALSVIVLQHHRAAADLDKLLIGDNTIGIEAIEITSQQRWVVCTDHNLLKQIETILHKSTKSNSVGTSYKYNFKFTTGRSYSVYGYLNEKGFCLSVPNANPPELGMATHVAHIPQNISNRLKCVLEFLHSPCKEVAGLKLEIQTNEPLKYSYLRKLHGPDGSGTRVQELTRLTTSEIPK